MSRVMAVLAAVVAAVALIITGSATAIIGGEFDGNQHPNVGY